MENIINKFNFKKIKLDIQPKSIGTIFVHTDTDLSSINGKKNIILSPAFYWCKKEDLEINSLRKAKKLAESIFFSSLPEGEYKYKTVKQNDEFLFFAYSEKFILDSLISQGLKEEFIGRVYFAQNEIASDRPVKISDSYALIEKEAIISVIPLQYAKDPINFSSLFLHLSSNYIKLKVNVIGNEKNEKLYLIASVILGVWLVSEGVHTYLLKAESRSIQEKIDGLNSKYNLPATSFQIDAIKNKYQKIEKKQHKIREVLTEISTFQTNEKEYFQKVTLDKNTLEALFFVEDEKGVAKIVDRLKKSFKDAEISTQKSSITVGITL